MLVVDYNPNKCALIRFFVMCQVSF